VELERLAAIGPLPDIILPPSEFGISEEDARSATQVVEEHERKARERTQVNRERYDLVGSCLSVCILILAFMKPMFFLAFILNVCALALLKDRVVAFVSGTRKTVASLHPKHAEVYDMLTRISRINYGIEQNRERVAQKHQKEREREKAEAEARELELRRRTIDYWSNMDPHIFEREIATLYRNTGFNAEVTRKGVDGGIDIKLRRGDEYCIVQCKRQNAQVGAKIVRELFGVMHAEGATRCILACTGGFNKNVRKFARGKPIVLLGLDEIILLANEGNNNSEQTRREDCTDSEQSGGRRSLF
jgi:hypothetical protein